MINRRKGFTLVELMVVIAIIGIISAIAFPSYQSYMKKGSRADAKVALMTIADRQERFYLQNRTYANTLANLGITSATSEEGYYTLSIDSGTVTGFKATATKITANDPACASLSIDAIGAQTSNGAVNDANNCW